LLALPASPREADVFAVLLGGAERLLYVSPMSTSTIMNGGQRALQPQGRAQFGQGHVGLALEVLANGDTVLGYNALFASGEMMSRLDAARFATLLEQLFDHTKGNAKALRDLITSAFALVIRTHDAFT